MKKKLINAKYNKEIVFDNKVKILIFILLIFFIQIIFSYFQYIKIIKRPVLVRGIDRTGLNSEQFSIFGKFLFLTNFDGKIIIQINKLSGNIEWEYRGINLVDVVMDSRENIYVLSRQPLILTKFLNKKKVREISLDENIEPINMAIDKKDNIYIADKKSNNIFKINLEGQILEKIKVVTKINESFIGKITMDFNEKLFVVVKPGIVKEYDINAGKWINEKLIPYLTRGDKAYSLTYVRRTKNDDIYVNDHMGSRILVFDKRWLLKGIFYQDFLKKYRFIACGPIDVDENYLYINNYIIFVYPLI